MRNAPVLLLLLASTGAAAADPPKPDCPAPQAETVHLYLKANGTETPAPKNDGACSAWSGGTETARGPRDGKDCTGPRSGPAKAGGTEHAIRTKGSGTSGRSPGSCPAPPGSSAAPPK